MATHSPKAESLRTATQRRHAAALKVWQISEKPDWLTDQSYREKIRPRLKGTTVPTTAATLGISEPYATDIRAGKRLPHPRHWIALGRLVGISQI